MHWRRRTVRLLLAVLLGCPTATASCKGTVTCGDALDTSFSLVQHSLRSSVRVEQQQDAVFQGAESCPAGYRQAVGDVPGWDQFGRDMGNNKDSIALCAADCSGRPSCASFEWSARTKICSLNKVADPTLGKFEDYILCQREQDVVRTQSAPALVEAAGSGVACPQGYEHLDGDVPGYDQFGRGSNNKRDTMELCAADCSELVACLSVEWSPTTKICSMNKVATPSAPRFQDYAFCQRQQEGRALGQPEEEQIAESADGRRGGCPEGYEFVEGDVPGGDQFGREKHSRRDSLDLCAAECNRRDLCKSLEWSPSRQTCNLNKVAGPVAARHKDFILCQRSIKALEDEPETPLAEDKERAEQGNAQAAESKVTASNPEKQSSELMAVELSPPDMSPEANLAKSPTSGGRVAEAEEEQVLLPQQPEPTSVPLALSSYEVGDLVEVANAESQNPLTAWLPGIVTAKSEHRAAYTVRLAQGGRRGEPLRGVPPQLLRKVDPQRHAAASVRLAKMRAQATQAAQEAAHEVAELEAAASAVRSATENAHTARLAQVHSPSAPRESDPLLAPTPALPARSLAAGDYAEVRLQGPLAEGRPGPWLPCSVAGADDAPTAYDLHFVAVPQALRELRDVPGYMLHRVDAKVYSQGLRRLREDTRAAQEAVGRLAEALGQGQSTLRGAADRGAEAELATTRHGDEQAKIRAAWNARHREEVARRAQAREAKRRADEQQAREEAIRQAKEEARQQVEAEVKQKVEEELKRKEEELRHKAARKATAELRRKLRLAASAPAATKETPSGRSHLELLKMQKPGPEDNEGVRVRVRDEEGNVVQLKVGRRTHLRTLINTASDKLLLPRDKTTLLFGGVPLRPLDTAESAGIRDLDLIEARKAQGSSGA